MKKIIIATFLTMLCSLLYAQNEGIHFENASNWQQMLAKAKTAHKYIFVDCYATWCGPCKKMDAEVYPDLALGKFINEQFVSVKVQMDTARADDENTKAWYADAHKLMTDNKVTAFPSFLFFTPDGKLVHKEIGFNDPFGFLQIALAAKDPSKQEYVLLDKYRNDKLPDSDVPRLISLLRSGDKPDADLIADKYIQGYLLELPDVLLYKPANIILISAYLKNSSNPTFALFYHNVNKIDQTTQKGYAESVITGIITKEEINRKLWSDAKRQKPIMDNPDWQSLYEAVSKKYNKAYADDALIDPQITWYKQHKNWPDLINVEIKKIKKYAIDSTGNIIPSWMDPVNEILYSYIFMYCTDKNILLKAIAWQKMIVDKNPEDAEDLDTYANLLYKTGKKKEAIELESKAEQLDIDKANKNKGKPNPAFTRTVENMKAGKITWDTTYQSN